MLLNGLNHEKERSMSLPFFLHIVGVTIVSALLTATAMYVGFSMIVAVGVGVGGAVWGWWWSNPEIPKEGGEDALLPKHPASSCDQDKASHEQALRVKSDLKVCAIGVQKTTD